MPTASLIFTTRGLAACLLATTTVAITAPLAVMPQAAYASVRPSAAAQPDAGAGTGEGGSTSLEDAARRAGETGRRVAISLIGLAFAIAAVVLGFKRDFKEAAGVFAVGLLAFLLASPAGVAVLRDTVTTLFGVQ